MSLTTSYFLPSRAEGGKTIAPPSPLHSTPFGRPFTAQPTGRSGGQRKSRWRPPLAVLWMRVGVTPWFASRACHAATPSWACGGEASTSIANTPVRRPMGTAISAFECWPKSRATTPRSIVALYTPCALSGFFCPTELTGNTGTSACASVSAASRVDPAREAAETTFPQREGRKRQEIPGQRSIRS